MPAVSVTDLRKLVSGATDGPDALAKLFHAERFIPDAGRNKDAAEALVSIIRVHLLAHMGVPVAVEVGLGATSRSRGLMMCAARGEMGMAIVKIVEQLVVRDTSRSAEVNSPVRVSASRLGFTDDLTGNLVATPEYVEGALQHVWWMGITLKSLIIGQRWVWDHDTTG